jgi:NADH dehydrogenase [ubiquinone] 1 alpha subcomplex assembly factor 7
MGKLAEFIRSRIGEFGYLDIAQFMNIALLHPEHGYYVSRDPLGKEGDFTTAPEVSQLFGEMIGVWLADSWIKLGAPSEFCLLECGGGRGTMMADILRATRNVSFGGGRFHDALSLHMLEASPVLKEEQRSRVGEFSPEWHESLRSVSDDIPLFIVGNEFFDALPFHQLVKRKDGWCERVVGENGEGEFCFKEIEADGALVKSLNQGLFEPGEGEVVEVSPQRDKFMEEVCVRLGKQGGAALFIDYGFDAPLTGDSFQAVKGHEYVSVFDDIGNADLTSHVNFFSLKNVALGKGMSVFGAVTQAEFLSRLGVFERASILAGACESEEQEEAIKSGLERLVSEKEMGSLFKVMAVCSDSMVQLEGFGGGEK